MQQEQETDQTINMKYASWSLSSSWYVWGNHFLLTEKLQYETPIYSTSTHIFLFIHMFILFEVSSRMVDICIDSLEVCFFHNEGKFIESWWVTFLLQYVFG